MVDRQTIIWRFFDSHPQYTMRKSYRLSYTYVHIIYGKPNIIYLFFLFFTIYGECVYLIDISMLLFNFSYVDGVVKKRQVRPAVL